MKAFLRKRRINLFAKNEEVRKLDFIKEVSSCFEYTEVRLRVYYC